MTHEHVLARLGRAAFVFPSLRHVSKRCVLYPARQKYYTWVYCFDRADRVISVHRGSFMTHGTQDAYP